MMVTNKMEIIGFVPNLLQFLAHNIIIHSQCNPFHLSLYQSIALNLYARKQKNKSQRRK